MATSIQQISVDPQQGRIFEWTKHLRVPIDRIAPTVQPVAPRSWVPMGCMLNHTGLLVEPNT